MNNRLKWILCLLLSYTFLSLAQAQTISGYIEPIKILPLNLVLLSKLDSGADSSSLNAKNIHFIQKEQLWVSFDIYDHNLQLKKALYPLYTMTTIKNRETENAPATKRPVILMKVQLGKKVALIKVNLINRAHFNYSFLLGREALVQFDTLINPGKTGLNPLSA